LRPSLRQALPPTRAELLGSGGGRGRSVEVGLLLLFLLLISKLGFYRSLSLSFPTLAGIEGSDRGEAGRPNGGKEGLVGVVVVVVADPGRVRASWLEEGCRCHSSLWPEGEGKKAPTRVH